MSLEDIESSSCADSQEIQSSEEDTNTEAFSEKSTELSSDEAIENNAEANEVCTGETVLDETNPAKIFENEIDQKLYEEVLEKLDIKSKEKNQDIQNNLMQEKLKQEAALNQIQKSDKSQPELQIKMAIAQDFTKIQKLMQSGLINSAQGQNLKKQVLKKAFDKLVQTEKVKRDSSAISQKGPVNGASNRQKVFEEFSQSNPDFFTSDGRKEVLNYLKSGDVILGKDDLGKISDIVRTVEKAAIDRYLKKVAHEKTLRQSNETAKQRLTANAQKSGFSGSAPKSFTREQIGKMSGAEFAKYESIIMENLKKGLIK